MYIQNNTLKTIKEDFTGNPVEDGRFKNLYGDSGNKSFLKLLSWKLKSNPKKKIKKSENYTLNVIKNISLTDEKKDFIYWLGHASFLIQIDGKRILTDPCLTSPPLIKRHTELPISIQDIKPDYLLISHAHYDHFDNDTIKEFESCTALIPLNMAKLLQKTNQKIQTQEAGWYQQYNIDETFTITFLPAHHWHKRTIKDTNKVLWGSFMIETKSNKTIYFAGDTGYSNHFKDIYKLFDKIDIAIIPIGAYEPRWFMKDAHISPDEALRASKELHADMIIPMYFGTFDLSDEPLSEPEQIFKQIGQNENIKFLDIGQKFLLN